MLCHFRVVLLVRQVDCSIALICRKDTETLLLGFKVFQRSTLVGLEIIIFRRWVQKCEMSLAIEDCMPLGRLLMLGWILDEISADGSFMGVGANLRPRLSTSISSLVRCSLDRVYYCGLLLGVRLGISQWAGNAERAFALCTGVKSGRESRSEEWRYQGVAGTS